MLAIIKGIKNKSGGIGKKDASVKEIKNGERLVCVGWIESYVKSIEDREYLFDLDAGAKGLLAKNGRSDELDLIFKSYSNLLRLLGN